MKPTPILSQRKTVRLPLAMSLGLCTSSLFAGLAIAEDEVDNIVVTGTRTTDILADVPYSATVINLDAIEARNEASVADLLRTVPGIHVTQPSGQGGVARVYVRGADLEMTMVLLDGVRVNDPNDSRGSTFDFSIIDLNDVERVEIVRGPQSAVYGSDALAGVINIISKGRADELGGSVYAEIGTDEYHRAALDVSGPIGDAGGFALRAATKDDGEPVPGTTFNSDSVSGRLTFADADRWSTRFFGNYTDSDGSAYPEDSGGYDLAVIRAVDQRTAEDFRLGLDAGAMLTERWQLNLLATWYDHDSSFTSPGVAPGARDPVPANGAVSTLERTNFAVNAVVDLSETLTATFGADYYNEDGKSDGYVEFFPGFNLPAGFAMDRSVAGMFGELHYRSDAGPSLLASVRHDDPDAVSAETTSKLGAMHTWNGGRTSVRANWGQGFKLPGFFALASPLVGNSALRPETSESLDIGLTQRTADGDVSATISVFRNKFTDLIDFDATIFQMVNRDRLEVDGAEVLLAWDLNEQLALQAQATWLDMDLVGVDEPLRQRPDWRGSLTVGWTPTEKWMVNASWLNVGKTFDSSVPTGDMYLDGYNRVDVTATYSPTDKLDLLFSMDNAFDENFYEAIGFPAVGARARVGVRYGF